MHCKCVVKLSQKLEYSQTYSEYWWLHQFARLYDQQNTLGWGLACALTNKELQHSSWSVETPFAPFANIYHQTRDVLLAFQAEVD